MKSIQELEREIEEAKKTQQEKIKQDALEREKHWIGKCFSSHLFQRVPKNGKEITIRRVKALDYRDNRVYYIGEHIVFRYYPQNKIFKVEIEDNWATDSPFPSWISSFSHEITNELFEAVYNEVQIHADTYFSKVAGLFKQTEYITQGDHSDEVGKTKWLRNQKFITLTKEGYQTSVKDILAWQHHPFLYGYDQLLDTKESIEIVKNIADEMEKNARSWGGSIWERDAPRIRLLIDFYQKHKHN